jgi:acyl-CoA reductase-like NAD-dependent aldehyde dehydrogenase
MTQQQELLNFVNGQWQRNGAGDALDVLNPATGAAIATVGCLHVGHEAPGLY